MATIPQSPPGSWPRLMRAETAAAYVDEPSVESFRRKVGSIYPAPVTGKGSRQKWDRLQLDQTGKRVWQPLECEDGMQLYPELEEMIARLPRVGVPMVALAAKRGPPRLYSESYSQHLVQRIRRAEGVPEHFTLEACRHGGMTELGDARLTEQDVMALSGHATPAAARLYVKRTAEQRLAAATQRRSYVEDSKRTKRG